MKNQLTTAVVLLACGVVLGGCDSKGKECNQVADIVNVNVDALQKVGQDLHAATDPAEEGKHAGTMVQVVQDASQKLDALEIRTEGLKPLVSAYIGMLKKVEEGGQEMVAQVKAAEEMTDAKIEAMLQSLQDAQEGIVKACETPTSDCPLVGAALEKLSDSPGDDQIAAAFSSLAGELEKLELKDGPVKTATVEFVRVIKEKVGFLEKAATLQKAVEAAGKKIDDAVASEDKIVDDLNNFCGGT